MVLGVQPQWHLPLLLCRALSTISASWWACHICVSIYRLVWRTNRRAFGFGSREEKGLWEYVILERIAIAQVALSFLWVSQEPPLAKSFKEKVIPKTLLTGMLGRCSCISGPYVRVIINGSLAAALFSICRSCPPLQSFDSPVLRLYAGISLLCRLGTRPAQDESEFVGVDHNFHHLDASLLFHPAGHSGGRGQGRSPEETSATIEMFVCDISVQPYQSFCPGVSDPGYYGTLAGV